MAKPGGPCRVAANGGACLDVSGNHATGTHNRAFADHDAWQDNASSADPGTTADPRIGKRPSCQGIVQRQDARAKEDIVLDDDATRDVTGGLDRYARADAAVAYVAIRADGRAFANPRASVNEGKGTDARCLSYRYVRLHLGKSCIVEANAGKALFQFVCHGPSSLAARRQQGKYGRPHEKRPGVRGLPC